LVTLHEEHLRRFLKTWRMALAASVSLPPTPDPAYASLGALGRHVLDAAGGYAVWICQVLGLPDPGIRPAPEPSDIIAGAEDYMEHVLERWRNSAIREIADDQMETPEYPSEWRTNYCIDSMLEHAVMHPIRHAFQLEELINGPGVQS
jgi:hypothetical protein